ncbi:O-antigen ligase family protein [Buttiauxella ferragutiae]|uniref:O-antigen ligase family protein n=1 Tax=Buttiauxella ferragutiae TaxID=82989 RepID=UPI003524AACF
MSILIFALLGVNLLSPYISSWMVDFSPFPPGAFLRDALNAAFVLFALIRCILNRKKINLLIALSIFSWLSLASWVVILIVFSGDKVQAIMGARSYILFPAVFFALVMTKIQYSKSINTERIINYMIFLMLFVSIVAIIDISMKGAFIKLLGYNEHYAGEQLKLINSYDGTIRATGGFSDALNFGYLLTLGILLCMERFSQGYKKLKMFTISLIIFIAICLTLTRGAILIAAIIYSFYIFSNRKLFISGFILLLIVVPTIFATTNFLDKYVDIFVGRFTDSSQTSRGSTQGRIDMAIKSASYLSENPLGVGLGTQGSGNMLSARDNRLNTDNYFFWMALETGLVGLIINLWYLSSQFYAAVILARTNRKNELGGIIKPFLLLVIIYFIASVLSSAPSSSTFSIFFWTVLALFSFPGLKNFRRA